MYKQPPDSTRLLFSVPNGPTSQPTSQLKKKQITPLIRLTKEINEKTRKDEGNVVSVVRYRGWVLCACMCVYAKCIHVPPFFSSFFYI